MKRDYLSRLARWARWYLPPAEAAEVLEDYREIAGERTDEALERDLGAPRTVVRQLAQPGAYRRWLASFLAMGICALLPALTPLCQELSWTLFRMFRLYWFWEFGENVVLFTWVFLAAGTALSLAWFRRGSRKELGRGVLPLLALLAVGIAYLWFMVWLLLVEPIEVLGSLTLESVRAMRLAMTLDIFAMGTAGLLGLVKFRLNSRRWGAVYVLGLAGVILGLSVWALLNNMAFLLPIENWQAPYFMRYIFITLVGLVGTAVSLC